MFFQAFPLRKFHYIFDSIFRTNQKTMETHPQSPVNNTINKSFNLEVPIKVDKDAQTIQKQDIAIGPSFSHPTPKDKRTITSSEGNFVLQ